MIVAQAAGHIGGLWAVAMVWGFVEWELCVIVICDFECVIVNVWCGCGCGWVGN